jgi:hypothetical protein
MPVLYYELHQEKDFGRLRTAARVLDVLSLRLF